MDCRQSGCNQPGRFEGYCKFCIGERWKPCRHDGCDQYMLLDKSGLCYIHRGHSDLLSAKEVASMLGVSTKQVQRLANDGRLPCIRTDGGHRRFNRGDVQAYMED